MSSLLTVLVLLFSTVLLSFTFDLIRRADLLLRIFDSCSDIIWEPSCSIVWAESATLDLGRVDVINYIYVLRSLVIAGLFILVLRSILLCLLICFRNFWYDSSAGCKSAVMKSGGLTPGICCAVSNLLNAFLWSVSTFELLFLWSDTCTWDCTLLFTLPSIMFFWSWALSLTGLTNAAFSLASDQLC